MKQVWIALALAACSNTDDLAKQKAEMDRAAHADDPPPSAAAPKQHMGSDAPPPTTAAKPPAAPQPDPTTPAEIDKARNQAMIDGRDKDVLHLCDLGKIDAQTPVNFQGLLGCTLAACRVKDADTAHRYGKPLTKDYRDAAARVCTQNQIYL